MNDIDHLDKRIESLVFRVTALEKVHKDTIPGTPSLLDTTPASLVERICLIFHKQQSPTYPARCEMAKEALLVAAEELLDEITIDEWEDACTRYGSNIPGATANAVLRSRLARAKEAAK